MTNSLVPPTSAPSPLPPASPRPSLSQLGSPCWRQLPRDHQPGELEALGFVAASEAAAQAGAWLAPLLWHNGQRVVVDNHRLLLDDGTVLETARPARCLLSAHGALRYDPSGWEAPGRRLVLVEGDPFASLLARIRPRELLAACPAALALDDERRRRLRLDLRRLDLRDRRVVLVSAAAGPLSPLLAAVAEELTAAGAVLHRAGPLPRMSLHETMEEEEATFGRWLDEAPPLAADAAPKRPARRLQEALPPALWAGPEHLAVPAPYVLGDGPSGPLSLQHRTGLVLLSSSAFWPIGQVEDPGGRQLVLAMIVHGGEGWQVVQARLPRAWLHDRRQLLRFLANHGLNVLMEGVPFVGAYLLDYLAHNTLPTVALPAPSRPSFVGPDAPLGREPLGNAGCSPDGPSRPARDDALSAERVTAAEEAIRGWVARQRPHLQPSRALRQRLAAGVATDEHGRQFTPRERALGQVVEAEREGEPGEVLRKVDILQSALTRFLREQGLGESSLTRALEGRGFLETTRGQSRQGAVGRNVRLGGTVTRVYRLVLATSAPSTRR